MKQPPDNWEDIEELNDHCTCGEYDWEEQPCPYNEEINDDHDDHCNCCPYCTQQCLDDI